MPSMYLGGLGLLIPIGICLVFGVGAFLEYKKEKAALKATKSNSQFDYTTND